jgi:hypothetical protein
VRSPAILSESGVRFGADAVEEKGALVISVLFILSQDSTMGTSLNIMSNGITL